MMTGGKTNLFDEEESVESEVIHVVQEKAAEEIKSAVVLRTI